MAVELRVGGHPVTVPNICSISQVPARTSATSPPEVGSRAKPHEIEIWFADDDDTLYMLSGGGDRSDWVRNLRSRAGA